MRGGNSLDSQEISIIGGGDSGKVIARLHYIGEPDPIQRPLFTLVILDPMGKSAKIGVYLRLIGKDEPLGDHKWLVRGSIQQITAEADHKLPDWLTVSTRFQAHYLTGKPLDTMHVMGKMYSL